MSSRNPEKYLAQYFGDFGRFIKGEWGVPILN